MPKPLLQAAAEGMPVSQLFRSPALRAAFARIERDAPGALVVADRPKPILIGGAAVRVHEAA